MKGFQRLLVFIPFFLCSGQVGTSADMAAQATLKTCVYDNPPLISYDSKKEATGLYIDILKDIAEKESWNLVYRMESWSECLNLLSKGKVDLVPAIAYSLQRSQQFQFNEETVVSNYGVVFSCESAAINSILDLNNQKIAVLRDDIYYSALKKLTKGFNISSQFIESETYDDVTRLLLADQVQAGLYSRIHSSQLRLPSSIHQTPVVLNPLEIRFAGYKSQTVKPLLQTIDHHLAAMKKNRDSAYYKALDDWLLYKPPIKTFPDWLTWLLSALCLATLIIFLFNYILRRKVNQKTEEIKLKNESLRKESNSRKAIEESLKENQKRFHTILDSLPIIIWAVDAKGVFLFSEGKSLKQMGLTSDEVVGKPIFDLFEDVPQVAVDARRALQGETFSSLIQIGENYYDTRYVPNRNDKNEISGVIGVVMDVTIKAHAQKQLIESEELFRTAFHTHPDSINVNRLTDGLYVNVNEGFTHLTGYYRDEVIGKSSLEINIWHDPKDREKLVQGLNRCGKVNNLEAPFQLKNGQVIIGLMSAAVISINDVPHILSVTRNIDEQKRVERKLRQSEERFRLAFDRAFVGRVIVDTGGRLVQANQSFASILGMSLQELLVKTWEEIVHPDFRSKLRQLGRKLLTNKMPSLNIELHLLHKKGHEVCARLNSVLVRDDQKRPLYVLADIEDITVRHKYEEQLRMYERIVGTSQNQMSLLDGNYVYKAVNESYLRTHNCKREEIIGHTVAEVNGEEAFLTKIKPKLDKAYSGQIVNYQAEFEYAGAGKKYVDVSYFPFTNEDGKTAGIVVHVQDITENKRLEQQLIRSQKLEAIGTLAGGIAHDFNNMLSAIFGFSQLAKNHIHIPEKAEKDISNIVRSALKAADLVQQILTFSRISNPEKSPLIAKHVIKETLKLLKASIPSTIEIKKKIVSNATILADSSKIHQLVLNLCTNAYHAMSDKGGVLKVELSEIEITDLNHIPELSIAPGRYLKLVVNDNGQGMDSETLEKIFDPYFTTKEIGKGTGLGLAVVHGIVDEHNGHIKVHSELNEGTTFEIFFPLTEKKVHSVKPIKPKELSLVHGTESIMLVDDDSDVLSSMQQNIEEFGYKVYAYPDGIQALREFEANPHRFHLIVTDMTMPFMTGLELSQKILERKPDQRIVLCSGFKESIHKEKALEAGVCAYFEKPILVENLVTTIRNLLDNNKPNSRIN